MEPLNPLMTTGQGEPEQRLDSETLRRTRPLAGLGPDSGPARVVFVQPAEPFAPMAELPASILLLATLVKEAGADTSILDARREGMTPRQAVDRVMEAGAQAVCVTGLNNAYRFIKDFCWELRRLAPEIRIVAGGPFIMARPEPILRRTPIDAACTGEGEEVVVAQLERLLTGRPLDGLCNTAFLRDGELVAGPVRRVEEPDRFSLPDYGLLDMSLYSHVDNRPYWNICFFPINTGRGCKHHCYYCGRILGRVIRGSPVRVVEHMDHLHEAYGLTNFLFDEDSAFYPKEWLLELCRLLTERPRPYRLNVVGCPDQLDDEIAAALKAAGCVQTAISVEHWDPLIQKEFFRPQQSAAIKTAWDICRRHGIYNAGFNLLWGHPKDDIERFLRAYENSIKVCHEYDFAHFFCCGLVVYQNSMLERDAVKAGKIEDFEDYMYANAGYAPYVNLTGEDDDNYRGVLVLLNFRAEAEKYDLAVKQAQGDPALVRRMEELRDAQRALHAELTALLALPMDQREASRERLEELLNVELYDKRRNYYREFGCNAKVLALPRGSRLALFEPQKMTPYTRARIFNAAREVGAEVVCCVAAPSDPDGVYERLPVVAAKMLATHSVDVLVHLEGSEELVVGLAPTVVTLDAEDVRYKRCNPSILVHAWRNPRYYDLIIADGDAVWRLREA